MMGELSRGGPIAMFNTLLIKELIKEILFGNKIAEFIAKKTDKKGEKSKRNCFDKFIHVKKAYRRMMKPGRFE
jgi:hypothetical protein